MRRYRARIAEDDSGDISLMAYDAILRNLAVLGEAAKSLSPELRREHDEIPWSSIIGLRNIVVHEYFGVQEELVLDIVDSQLEPLLTALKPGSSPTQ